MDLQASDLARTYRRKVAGIKKSVYVNIPSKIAREMSIAKGSVLDVTFQEGRIVLSTGKYDVARAELEEVHSVEDGPQTTSGESRGLRGILEANSGWSQGL